MSNNSNPKTKLQGSIDLAALNGIEYGFTKDRKKAIIIPLDSNPCIFVTEPKDANSRRKVLVDVDILPTPKSKFNTHMAKATVGQKNLEKFGLNRDDRDRMAIAEPILGNFNEKPLGGGTRAAGKPADPMDGDMPDFTNAGNGAPLPESW